MGRIERTRRRGRRARYARSHAVASHNPSLRQGPKVSLRSAPGGPATYQTASNGSLSSQAHYEKLRSFQLRARLRDAAEGPRSTMAAPRGYWLTAKGHCTSRQLVATRKGPAPMGILRTHNKPQLLRPHRQVFSHPPPWALCRRPTGMCFAHVLSTYSDARGSCAARENYWLSQQRKLLFPPAAKLIHFAKQYLSLHT